MSQVEKARQSAHQVKLVMTETETSNTSLSTIIDALVELRKQIWKQAATCENNPPSTEEIQSHFDSKLGELLRKDGKIGDWVNLLLEMRSMILFHHVYSDIHHDSRC